jgi:hypothetical protein
MRGAFTVALLPAAVAGLTIEYIVLRFGFRRMLAAGPLPVEPAAVRPLDRRLTGLSLGVLALVFAGLDVYRTAANTPAISLIGSSSQISAYGNDGQENQETDGKVKHQRMQPTDYLQPRRKLNPLFDKHQEDEQDLNTKYNIKNNPVYCIHEKAKLVDRVQLCLPHL